MSDFVVSPCDKCEIKNGYGGDYRCACCELTKLRAENQRLQAKIKKRKPTDREPIAFGKWQKID